MQLYTNPTLRRSSARHALRARHQRGRMPSSRCMMRRTVAMRRQPWTSFQRRGVLSVKG